MKRHRPDPDQTLFPWTWQGDEPEPEPEEDDPPPAPPLQSHVRDRHAERVVALWGWPVRLARTRPRT